MKLSWMLVQNPSQPCFLANVPMSHFMTALAVFSAKMADTTHLEAMVLLAVAILHNWLTLGN